jgi:class 3 adenylate cyclase
MMARLDVVDGVKDHKSFPLLDEVGVGRSPSNTICLSDHQVSRNHARILRQGEMFVIEDLQSTNGVMLRGKRIPAGELCKLADGDELIIGSAHFVFHLEETTAAVEPEDNWVGMAQESPSPQPQISLQREFGSLIVAPWKDEAAQPSVALALDASASMMVLDAHETQINRGVQEALRRLRAMCQVSTTLGMITDREILLERIVECIFEIFPAADRLCVMLRERGSDILVPVVARKRDQDSTNREQMTVSRAIIQEVITRKRSVLSFDAMGDKRFGQHASVINLSIRSMMCAPLLVGDEILGLIQVDSHTGPNLFTSEDLQILTGISAQAAVTVKNMQLYEAVQTETARRTSLQRYFTPGVVELLMSGNLSTTLGGSGYHGTILFADIIGFTAMSEALAPAEVVTRLNRYFSIMQRVIYEHGGNVDKLNGDSIMAFWGVPYHEPGDEWNAVLTAMLMQQYLWCLNLSLHTEQTSLIHTGIGINTGEFVAGNIGSEDKIEFTLIGDAVNLAARIEAFAGRYQILVAETTWQAIRHQVAAVRMPPVLIKGKSKPVTIYSIRTVHNPSRDELLMSLPCDIWDAADQEAFAQGMILSATEGDGTTQIVVSADRPLQLGATYTLRLGLVEYHEELRISGTVDSFTSSPATFPTASVQALLTVTLGSSVLHSLAPGNCLASAVEWHMLRRS